MIFLVSSGKMIFLFPENMILFFRRKIEDDLSGKKQTIRKIWGFTMSTDHRPTDHRPTDHRPLTHQPTDIKFANPLTKLYFKDLIIKKYLFCRIQTQLGKCKTILFYLTFVFVTNTKNIREELRYIMFIIMFIELCFKQ